MGLSPTFGARRFPKGERKELWCARRRKPFFRPGLTRRLRRGRWGCRPEGGSTFFRSERKYQRKPAARRLREKALYCPFCRRGSLCRAQHDWPDFTCDPSRSELAFFRRQNGRAFFPPLPIAARLRLRLGGGEGQIARVGMIRRGAVDLARQTAKGDPNHVGLWREPRDLPSSGGLYRPISGRPHQTREPRGLSPSGGKTPDNLHVPLRPCAP